ncbi:hypothetical protein [Streptomyces malaysiensis]|uniref:Uncharacterized protein n=1 Tax=Streptomyces malaysiensis subsp. samsunensis TaxID=459658 RepID=A0A9X2LU01_STRMQ|nr:hypothetical protein [Streptomyces samsunensis]MCQ8829728.1 hypothetical protein [Streptomyces samsunensis]
MAASSGRAAGQARGRATAEAFPRCHYVTTKGVEHQLIPDPASAEGRRARLDRAHPALSRCIGLLSLVVLVIGLVLLILQLMEQITRAPEGVSHYVGTFTSPIDMPAWGNIVLGLVTVAASTERALRLR